MVYAIGGVLIVVGVILIAVGRSKSGLKSAIDQTPTTPVGQLVEGQHAEVKGVVSCDSPLQAPAGDTPCVHYSYEVKRRERRRSSGESGSSYQWRTIDSGSTEVPFTLTDPTGSVTVDPAGAKIDAPVVVDRYVDPAEDMADGILKTIVSGASALAGSRQKIQVRAVAVGRDLYVLGDVQRGADGELRVAKGEKQFFLSTKSEEQLRRSLGLQSWLLYAFGALAAVGGIVVLVAKLVAR